MDEIAVQRFEILKKEFVTAEEIRAIFGINIGDSYTLPRLEGFIAKMSHNKNKIDGDKYSRYFVERFLQFYRLIPFNFAAIRLGMNEQSFKIVLEKLDEKGIIIQNTLNYPEDLIDESIIKDFHKFFNATQNTIFSSHTNYCYKLHLAIADELKYEVEAVFCQTSEYLKEPDKLYAHNTCYISKQPTSLKYTQYMNFGKPISLLPDLCSKLFLYQNRSELEKYVFGDIPDFSEFN